MTDINQLALDAHRRGQNWSAFWRLHADGIREAQPVTISESDSLERFEVVTDERAVGGFR